MRRNSMHMLSYKPLVGFGHTDNTDTYRLPVLARVANLASHTQLCIFARGHVISQHNQSALNERLCW